ncbi:c-type cytochrome [Aquiflexum gelatinilyticum]|uniref:C-type cytochrome n=1 Tax=Aquiflexum gelatinilyticum TaxID=2961943 RepID=A0A9X2P3V8_9BACT|nr:c-type cytochrome [Aquiflexum gelatinilyticum]MCR9015774.1 c-type cytochrome [Aquiflexum gelatinilyticum]
MKKMKGPLFIFLISLLVYSCAEKKSLEEKSITLNQKEKDYIKAIPGEDQELDAELIKKGEVLVAYSDCYDCHKEVNRAKGPAFRDIAKRYPANTIYIEHLARQVIRGSKGSWGYPVMSPHPQVKKEDAEAMVTFILSLRGQ